MSEIATGTIYFAFLCLLQAYYLVATASAGILTPLINLIAMLNRMSLVSSIIVKTDKQ